MKNRHFMQRILRAGIALMALCLLCQPLEAQEKRVFKVFSNKMQREVACQAFLPDNYKLDNSVRYPVVYLLHGYSGNENDWFGIVPQVGEWCNRSNIIIVTLDGENSWYFDSPLRPDLQYETFVSKELIEAIDQKFRTIDSPKARAITGLSMGGHGALRLAMRHSDVFGAAGSMSGGVDFRPFENNWEIKDAIGEKSKFPARWDSLTVMAEVEKLKDGQLTFMFDCGTDDFFIGVNRALHQRLLERKIKHDYTERPGVHNWDFWANSVNYHMLFFTNFFNQENAEKK